jgi:DNA-binding CsgD family transcriptional regulator
MVSHGDLAAARPVLEEAVALHRQLGGPFFVAHGLDALGRLATADGHHSEAQSALHESLRLRCELGDTTNIARTLESIAALCAAKAQPERAVHLAGAASAIRENLGEMQSPMERARMNHWLAQLRQALGSEATTAAWEAGRATSLEEAVELAPAETPRPRARRKRPPKAVPQHVTVLSPRQQQVAALLARDLSNQQIAGQLVITQRTVAAHIEHILDKLGFASRHQIGAWAIERGLLN